MNLYISKIDSKRFGLNIGRIDNISPPLQVSEISEFIQSHHLDCLIARCSSKETAIIHGLENAGFRFMEGRIRFIYQNIQAKPDFPVMPLSQGTLIRAGTIRDNLENIVRSSFAGYKGHYHQNPYLNNDECDNVYVDWALNSLMDLADDNYLSVIERSQKLLGFATGKKDDEGNFVGGLLAIAPSERKQGLASALHYHRLQWCKEKGMQTVIVPTSINNWAYQNLLIKLGYSVLDTDLTFHWTLGTN